MEEQKECAASSWWPVWGPTVPFRPIGRLCPSHFTEDAKRGHGSPRSCKLMSSIILLILHPLHSLLWRLRAFCRNRWASGWAVQAAGDPSAPTPQHSPTRMGQEAKLHTLTSCLQGSYFSLLPPSPPWPWPCHAHTASEISAPNFPPCGPLLLSRKSWC